MSSRQILLACISGQKVSLEPARDGDDLRRLLADASENSYLRSSNVYVKPYDRKGLLALAKHLNSPPNYKIKVDGNPTTLKITQGQLFSHSLIILTVKGKTVKMQGIREGSEPRNGNGLDWKTIKETDYKWNLGKGKIQRRSGN